MQGGEGKVTAEFSGIASIWEAYDLGPISHIRDLSTGYGNQNHVVSTDQDTYFLRIYRDQPLAQVRGEMAVLRDLQNYDFPTAYPIARLDGEWISIWDGEPVVLYPFLRGGTPVVSRHSGRTMGQVVAQLALVPPPQGFSRPNIVGTETLRVALMEVEQHPNMLRTLRERFLKHGHAFAERQESPLPRGLVHGDVFPENTLFEKEQLVALVDFEAVCEEVLVFDLAMTIHGFGYRNNCLDQELCGGIIEAYEQIRPLSEAERKSIPEFLCRAALGMSAWHIQYLLKRPLERQSRRVEEWLERLDALSMKGATWVS